jgi:hypothetical protein
MLLAGQKVVVVGALPESVFRPLNWQRVKALMLSSHPVTPTA